MNIEQELQNNLEIILGKEGELAEQIQLINNENDNEYYLYGILYLSSLLDQNNNISNYDEITGKLYINKKEIKNLEELTNGAITLKKDVYFLWDNELYIIKGKSFQFGDMVEYDFIKQKESNDILRSERRGRGY